MNFGKSLDKRNYNIIKNDNFYLTAFCQGKAVASCRFLKDKYGDVWLAGIEVNSEFERLGIATALIREGVNIHGEIFFAKLPRADFNQLYPNYGYDIRYLTPDGIRLVECLIKKGVITEEWYKNQRD